MSMRATLVARRPSTTSVASTTNQFAPTFSASASSPLATYVLIALSHTFPRRGKLQSSSLPSPLSTKSCSWGARPQNSGWSLIRCGGVFFLYLTAYDVVRQEAPDDHF